MSLTDDEGPPLLKFEQAAHRLARPDLDDEPDAGVQCHDDPDRHRVGVVTKKERQTRRTDQEKYDHPAELGRERLPGRRLGRPLDPIGSVPRGDGGTPRCLRALSTAISMPQAPRTANTRATAFPKVESPGLRVGQAQSVCRDRSVQGRRVMARRRRRVPDFRRGVGPDRFPAVSERDCRVATSLLGKSGKGGRQVTALAIRFVAATHGMVRGTMEPSWDPDRECRAQATFLGSADGDLVTGSFVSVCDDGTRMLRGRWRVERRRADHATPRDPIAQRGPLDLQQLGGLRLVAAADVQGPA